MHGIWNNAKTVLLMGALMGLALLVGELLGGGPRMLVPALVIGGLLNFVAYFYSDKIALKTMRAQQVTRSDDPELWDTVERLSHRAGLPMPRVYVAPMAAPNAFATGRNPKHAAVCVTVGLRQMLTREELAGVVAHELAHVKHRDVLIGTVAAVMAGAIVMVTRLAFWFGMGGRDNDRNPLAALLMLIFAPIAALLVQMAVSRSREYEADRYGAEVSGNPAALAHALQKLALGNRRVPMPVLDSQRNLFIVEPFLGRRDLVNLFQTHPPTEKRVARLMELAR